MKRGHNIIAIDGVNGKDVRECGEFVKSVFVDADVEVAYFTFPNYSSETGKILARYIAEDIDLQPFVAHTLFALNRFEQKYLVLHLATRLRLSTAIGVLVIVMHGHQVYRTLIWLRYRT